MMKKTLVLAMAMALGVTASAYAANPFSDVPAGHWAYDAVNRLAVHYPAGAAQWRAHPGYTAPPSGCRNC